MRLFALFLIGLLCCSVEAAAGDRVIVRGDNGYEPLRLKKLAVGTSIDLKGAQFRVAISGNDNPTEAVPCKLGKAPINRYPFAVENSPNVTVRGGLFAGEAPQSSDWLYTYCNSAAVRLEQSPGAVVREARMRRVWDGIRLDEGSSDFRIARVWMSDVRDDCIENDHLLAGRIRDSLFDGCFAGISVAPIDGTRKQPNVRLNRVLLRMKQYPYREKLGHAMPIKVQESGGARFQIDDSIFAIETTNLIGGKHIQTMWNAISRCSNNKLLWLGEGELPEIYAGAPACFQRISGSEARSVWAREKQRWIVENEGVARFTTDDPM